MKKKKEGLRVVAIDPCTSGFAYAVFEGRDNLVDWGVMRIYLWTGSNVRQKFKVVLGQADPEQLILEDGRGRRRGPRAKELLCEIRAVAKERELPVIRISKNGIRRTFPAAQTKHGVAEAIAALFPELAPRLPRRRKAWTSEDDRMNIFDAVALGFASFSKQQKR